MLSMNSDRFDPDSAFYESANYQLELGYKSLELAKKLENHYKFKRTPANYALTVELKSEYFRKKTWENKTAY